MVGGPTMTARVDQVRTVREARDMAVTAIAEGGEPSLIATGRLADFRVCLGDVGDGSIDPASAAALNVTAGSTVSHVAR